jgi:hypothetical protein
MDDTTFPLMTRRQFVDFVQRQTGIPLTYSRLMKDGAIGRAPRAHRNLRQAVSVFRG